MVVGPVLETWARLVQGLMQYVYRKLQGRGGRLHCADDVRVIEVLSTALVGFEELRCQQGWDAKPGPGVMDVRSMKLVDSSVVQSHAEFKCMSKGEVGLGSISPKIQLL